MHEEARGVWGYARDSICRIDDEARGKNELGFEPRPSEFHTVGALTN